MILIYIVHIYILLVCDSHIYCVKLKLFPDNYIQ